MGKLLEYPFKMHLSCISQNSFSLFIFLAMADREIVNHNYSKRSEPKGGFKTMKAFYPFYLGEHCNAINRRLHILGTFAYLFILFLIVLTLD